MSIETLVAENYARSDLEAAIDAALVAAGKDLARLTPADLAGVDEFHVGGRTATVAFADALAFTPGQHLLDIGSGLGGPSRYFASERGCRVTGIDLSPDYVRTATSLAARLNLADRVDYRQGSAVELPFEDASFDGAMMLHVGMNVADKAGLFSEVRRVLKQGAAFGIYDIMREAEGELAFPVPWAATPEGSFVETAAMYEIAMQTWGFVIERRRSLREPALASMREMRARQADAGVPPALGLHVVMGPSMAQRAANLLANVERGLVAPTEIIGRAV